MKKFVIILLAFLPFFAISQDLDCRISVSSKEIDGTDKEIFTTLQTSLYEFMNSQQWTPYQIELKERMEVTMLLNIKERISQNEFKATLNVVASRPIFNTSYNSPIFNYIDKDFHFIYTEYEPITFIENSYVSNLSSVLGFYAYFLYGLEFETFALDAGSPFFDKALNVVNVSQSSGESGWKAFDSDKNRYWLTENFMNPAYKDIKSFLYQYHRMGLDLMADDINTGRANLLNSLDYLKKVHEERPGLFILNLVLDAKRTEIINVFSEAPLSEKQKVVEIMKDIDPANGSKYQELLD